MTLGETVSRALRVEAFPVRVKVLLRPQPCSLRPGRLIRAGNDVGVAEVVIPAAESRSRQVRRSPGNVTDTGSNPAHYPGRLCNRAPRPRCARTRLRRAVDPGANPRGLTARAGPVARPEVHAVNLLEQGASSATKTSGRTCRMGCSQARVVLTATRSARRRFAH
jgi:hypothetical protein